MKYILLILLFIPVLCQSAYHSPRAPLIPVHKEVVRVSQTFKFKPDSMIVHTTRYDSTGAFESEGDTAMYLSPNIK